MNPISAIAVRQCNARGGVLRVAFFATTALVTLMSAGCGTVVPSATNIEALPVASTVPLPSRFELSPGDEVDVRYGDAPQLDQSLRVRPDGDVSLPYLGSVRAAGLTPDELQQELRRLHAALADPHAPRRYLLQAGDELDIKFAYAPDVNEVVKVRPDGALQLPLVGKVNALGLTPEELQAQLQARYARYLRRPDLAVLLRNSVNPLVEVDGHMVRAGTENMRPTVVVRSSAPTQVFVGGEVQKPGVLAFRSGLSLLQAVIEAGGRLPTAELRRVMVLRRVDNVPTLLQRDLSTAIPQDMALAPGDVVLLPQTRVASIAEALDQYVFKLFPPIRNSSFGFVYDFRGNTNTN